jgi:urease subunit alpha
MFGSYGRAVFSTCYSFVSKAAVENGTPERLGLNKLVVPIRNCRAISKANMIHNDLLPNISVDPETYEVRVDGELLTCEPADVLPMAQRYFLF